MSSNIDRKVCRRTSSSDTSEDNDEISDQDKKAIHRAIEKQRREAEQRHMKELRDLLPHWYTTKSTKLTQLVVLERAADLLEQINGHDQSNSVLPSYLTPDEIHFLNLETSNTFLFLTTIESNIFRVIHVNDSIHRVLHLTPNDWIGQNLFQLIHPDDLQYVYDQLSLISQCIDNKPSFACRVKQENNSYTSVTISGMIKKLDRTLKPISDNEDGFYAFVALCQIPLIKEYSEKNMQRYRKPQSLTFSCRCSPIDWKIFLVDCSVSTLPSVSFEHFRERSILEFLPIDERDYVHQQLLNSTVRIADDLITCHFVSPSMETLFMLLQIKPICNPVTKRTEYVELIFENLPDLVRDLDQLIQT